MKKKNVVILVIAALAIGLLASSCDVLFQNQFKTAGLGQLTGDALKTADAATLLADAGVSDGEISQSFIDAILADPEVSDAVKATLEATLDNPEATPEEFQQASIVLIEIVLQESGADEIIDNFMTILSGLDFTSIFGSKGLAAVARPIDYSTFDPLHNAADAWTLLDMFIPEDLKADDAALAATLNALASLETYYDDLGANILAHAGVYAFDGVDAGTVAQTAVVVRGLALVGFLPPHESIGDAVVAGLNDLPENFFNHVDLSGFMVGGEFSFETFMTDNLNALLLAAGYDLSALMPAA